jgi:hypothetical protein
MDMKQIKAWKATLEAEIKSLDEKAAALNSHSQKKRQQLDLITKLLDSEIQTNSPLRHAEKEAATKSAGQNPTPNEVKDRVLEILLEANRPMNIKEIHAEFVRRGLPIPGKGTPFNILVHMSREVKKGAGSRLYRTGKGTYALRRNSDNVAREHRTPNVRTEAPRAEKVS